MKQSIHARRMAKLHKRNQQQPKLNLVSLMDIFTILVFFLLVNSSNVEVLQDNRNIRLPDSVAEQMPEEALIIALSRDDLIVNGRRIVSVADIEAGDDDIIGPLKTELEYLAAREPYASDEARALGRSVTIMGDSSIPYTVLKRVMTTCAEADYRNIALAVSQMVESDPVPAAGG